MNERPYIDPEITSHEGYDDAELSAMLEVQAALLDVKGFHGIAHDIRAGAQRIRQLSGESK
jgi:hypothetical protein